MKHKERQENLQSRLEIERDRRMEAERDSESWKHEVSVLRENHKGEEKRISDESRFLYAEAFGSINLGIGGSAKSDSEVSCQKSNFSSHQKSIPFRSIKLEPMSPCLPRSKSMF